MIPTVSIAEERCDQMARDELKTTERLCALRELAVQGRKCLESKGLHGGGCLFLGRHYAHPDSRLLMLGINPGINKGAVEHLDTKLQGKNCLLEEGPPDLRYFNNARFFFNSPPLSPYRSSVLETATYSYCCPYRTKNWSGLQDKRKALIEVSGPVLSRIILDCQPRLIVIAGKAGYNAFCEILGDKQLRCVECTDCHAMGGLYHWAAYRAELTGVGPVVIAQVPHFSRANSREKLEECATWLASLIRNEQIAT
jgi:hypothetical protein